MQSGTVSTNQHPTHPFTGRPAADVPVHLLGPAVSWFEVTRDPPGLTIRPKERLPRRCALRPAALFQQARGFPELNVTMGKLLFPAGTTDPQRYEPFTRDPDRRFREVFLQTEPCPDDDLFHSDTRWRNAERIARILLDAAGISWGGFSDREMAELLDGEPWLYPVEGCVLHALAGTAAGKAGCVIEIGSYRGLSLAMLARGLRSKRARDLLVSIDPHEGNPANIAACRQALQRIGELPRLIQVVRRSDEAFRLFAPGSAGLIFIDGDHEREQVAADIEHYAPLLAPGGFLAFHDYGYGPHNGRPDVVPGVRSAVDRHVFPREEFTPLLLAHTLMVFRKRS
ncbi:MAG: class I SAM-dependent methyltransferase [Planctomycetota bacterium]|nr:MAG: class I SAM-dependent methyltransferase [Planctomycetota bacterium]